MSKRDVATLGGLAWLMSEQARAMLEEVRYERDGDGYKVLVGGSQIGWVHSERRETHRKYKGSRLRFPSGHETVWCYRSASVRDGLIPNGTVDSRAKAAQRLVEIALGED